MEIAVLIGHALLLGLGLLYRAVWPILFGVFITALIETLVDQKHMAEILGGRDLLAVGRASVAGAASSACTYGAVSITQTLFKKGASTESSFAFAFASTNLVFELGILIWILLGWQFLAAELLGGFVLIATMYLLVRATLPRRTFEAARARLREQMPGDAGPVRFTQSVSAQGDWKRQLTTLAGWARIARNYFHTLGRIYKSVIFGFLIAGFIVTLMPAQVWRTLFLGSATLPGVLENAAMGVTAGVLSFIGSIGNVPFAAALWVGGVSFAGVIACIYADLITVPVLSLWRKFFGWKAMLYIFAVFFLTMVSSAVLMEYLFRALDWIPPRLSSASFETFVHFRFDVTFAVTVLALVATAVLYGLIRLQARTDGNACTSRGA